MSMVSVLTHWGLNKQMPAILIQNLVTFSDYRVIFSVFIEFWLSCVHEGFVDGMSALVQIKADDRDLHCHLVPFGHTE